MKQRVKEMEAEAAKVRLCSAPPCAGLGRYARTHAWHTMIRRTMLAPEIEETDAYPPYLFLRSSASFKPPPSRKTLPPPPSLPGPLARPLARPRRQRPAPPRVRAAQAMRAGLSQWRRTRRTSTRGASMSETCALLDVAPSRVRGHTRLICLSLCWQVDYGATPEEIQGHFAACGQINRVTILCDKFTGHPKGSVLPPLLLPSFRITADIPIVRASKASPTSSLPSPAS